MNDIITPFNYSSLPAPVATEIEAATTRIKDRLTRQVKDIIETGHDLIEVKSKLEHGQFERWLDSEFGMAVRTAQRFMRASEWAQDKNDIVSHLTPTTVYMLSAKSTPEGVHQRVVERLEGGLPAEPEYVRHVVHEAKLREREAKNRKGKREARGAQKRRESPPGGIKNRRECQRAERRAEKLRKKKEQSERESLAANFSLRAHDLAIMLIDDPKFNVRSLAERTEDELDQTLRNFDILYKRLREAIKEVRQSHGDNVTLLPPKPWGAESCTPRP